jgi:hypothetical protein
MVITRPSHDVTMLYLTYWSKEIIDQAKKHSISVVDLRGNRANKKEFSGVIRRTRPSLVVVNGHGNCDTLMGQDNEVLVATGKNEQLFADAIVYARSCESAKNLGPSCIRKGTRAYIGYKEDFVFFINEAYMRDPLRDATARIFLEPANRIVIALLKGHTAGAAHEKSKEMYSRTMQTLLTSETPREERELVPYIHWNMMHQVCLGDGEAKIV